MSEEAPPPTDGEKFDVVVSATDGVTVPEYVSGKWYVNEDGTAFYWMHDRKYFDNMSIADVVSRLNDANASSARGWADITDYSDERLIPMWEEAGRIADRAGHCSVYDDLVRELGGIPREREYRVSVPVTGDVVVIVRASSEEDAEEIARGMVDADNADDLELDWSNAYIEQN